MGAHMQKRGFEPGDAEKVLLAVCRAKVCERTACAHSGNRVDFLRRIGQQFAALFS